MASEPHDSLTVTADMKREFAPEGTISDADKKICFDFAFGMSYGKR